MSEMCGGCTCDVCPLWERCQGVAADEPQAQSFADSAALELVIEGEDVAD